MFSLAAVLVSAIVSFAMLILGLVLLGLMQRRGFDPVARIVSWFDPNPSTSGVPPPAPMDDGGDALPA